MQQIGKIGHDSSNPLLILQLGYVQLQIEELEGAKVSFFKVEILLVKEVQRIGEEHMLEFLTFYKDSIL